MNFRHLAALPLLVSSILVTIALDGAAAQAPPPANQAAPPAAAPTQPAPTASPASPPPPSQAAPPPAPAEAAPPPAAPPPPQSGPAPSATAHDAAHAVTHTNVNLRDGPGTAHTVITLIHAGASVEVDGCKSGWCQVVFEGQNGYIIETSIAPGGPGRARRPGSPPGYAGPPGPPPAGYAGPPPGYYPPPPGYYPPPYYYGGYYGPYWGWRRGYWRRW